MSLIMKISKSCAPQQQQQKDIGTLYVRTKLTSSRNTKQWRN